jgi:hypothetical protein
MKKIVAVMVLLSSMVFAQKVVNQTNMKIMKDLEEAISLIQKGFMYNNTNVVENGVAQVRVLVQNSEAFRPNVTKKEAGFDTYQYAQDEAKVMGDLAERVLTQFKSAKDKDKSLETYQTMLNRCVECHKLIRKW